MDAFIANKRSKSGKRFGFVRFLGVKNEEQLARSLASIWIGSYHIFAFVARFNRQEKIEVFSKNNRNKKTNSIPSQKADHVGSSQNKKSYASSLNGDRDSKVEKQVTAVKGNTLSNVPLTPSSITPALVLDDSCVMNNSQKVRENVTSNEEYAFNYSHNAHNGGSILEVLDDMIRVGQSMGYAMKGCMKDIEHIIGTQGVDAIPK
nr:RNA-directed DNA polymerase, eukaryota, reverse transcriptase zinc-binding domain protein [Tanacetum cinerariifolium]